MTRLSPTGPDHGPHDPRDHGLLRPQPADAAEVDRLVAEGLLRRVIGDVFAPSTDPDTAHLRARAVLFSVAGTVGARRTVAPLADPSAAVIGHQTAVWLHAGGEPPARVDVVIAPGSTRLRSATLRLHEHRLGPGDVDRIGGVLVTGPVRTAADVARTLAAASALRHLDALARECGVGAVDVLAQLEQMSHGRGVARARGLVHTWASTVASRPAGP